MQTYIVGGWVRDRLLENLDKVEAKAGDRDWVVVGASPALLQEQGFRAVGRDFPVFLHPATQEEFALARTERKTAPGYRGFVVHASPEVTLDEDLARRDLTINAMAYPASVDAPPGRVDPALVIDPYGGREDLRHRVLRHVGAAFVEDPVRLLRLARFAARLPDFSVAESTLHLAREMVERGETDALVPERVWQEVARGLMEDHPSRMFDVLDSMGLLARIAPGLCWDDAAGVLLDTGANRKCVLAERFALLAWAMPGEAQLQAWLTGWRCDSDSAQLALLAVRWRDPIRLADRAAQVLEVLDRTDAWRRPARFEQLLMVLGCAWPAWSDQAWRRAWKAGRDVAVGDIARQTQGGPAQIAAAIAEARLRAVAQAIDR